MSSITLRQSALEPRGDSSQYSFPLLPREVQIPGLISTLELAISSLAVLKARVESQPWCAAASPLIQQADTILADNMHCVETDFLDLLSFNALGGNAQVTRVLRPTVSYLKALQAGIDASRRHVTDTFTLAAIKNLHRLVTADIAARGSPGEFRADRSPTEANRQRWGFLQVSPPDQVTACMQDVEAFLLNPPPMPLVLRVALVYAQIEMIVPFSYGSGELARIIVQMMLAAEGYPSIPMSSLMAQDKGLYDAGIVTLRNQGDWNNWLSLFLNHFTTAIRELTALFDTMLQVRAAWDVSLAGTRRDAAARRVVDLLMVMPAVTVSNVQQSFDMSFQTANSALATLSDLGIVSIMCLDRSSKRNRVFVAKDVVRSLVDVMQR